MKTYNLPEHISGDTWCGISGITIVRNGSALDLTGAKAELNVKFQLDAPLVLQFSTENNTILILDPPEHGVIQVPSQVVNIPPLLYNWTLKVTLSSGEIETFVSGKWQIINPHIK